MVVPGLHSFTIPTGAATSCTRWATSVGGIGALKGAYIIETEAYSDLRNILALWANESDFNANIIEHLAISLEALRWALSAEGQAAMPDLLTATADETTLRTYHILQKLAENFVAGDERGYAIAEAMMGREQAASTLVGARRT